jgi:hypothetical protein
MPEDSTLLASFMLGVFNPEDEDAEVCFFELSMHFCQLHDVTSQMTVLFTSHYMVPLHIYFSFFLQGIPE